MKHTTRRLALATGGAGLALPAFAQGALPELHWRLGSSFPRNLDILFGGSVSVARRVGQLTGGKFRITALAAGEGPPPLQILDAVQSGAVELGQTASYYYLGKDPTFAFFCAVPFGMNHRQASAWYNVGGGRELGNELYGDYNCVGIQMGDTGAQMGGWFRREIRNLQDVQGLKFRIAGLGGQVFQRMGATSQVIAGADIYPALERGVIDAAEWVGPYDDEKLGFVRVARYYYAPGFWEGAAPGVLLIHKPAWESLPDIYKQVLEAACAEATREMMAKYDAANPQALRRLVAAGAQLRYWPRDVLQAAWNASNELYAETSRTNPRFARVWENYKAFRDEQFQWFRVCENSYENFVYPAAAGR